MKKILLLIAFSLSLCLFASNANYKELSRKTGVPLSKFRSIVLSMSEKDSTFVVEDNLELIKSEFEKNKMPFSYVMVFVGMLVVFVSLMLIGWIISLLKHTAEKKKEKPSPIKTVSTSIGKVSAPEGDLSTNSIVAVITALHLHLLEVQQQNKINMDWRRAPVSMWKAVSKAKFPNQDHSIQFRR